MGYLLLPRSHRNRLNDLPAFHNVEGSIGGHHEPIAQQPLVMEHVQILQFFWQPLLNIPHAIHYVHSLQGELAPNADFISFEGTHAKAVKGAHKPVSQHPALAQVNQGNASLRALILGHHIDDHRLKLVRAQFNGRNGVEGHVVAVLGEGEHLPVVTAAN